MLTICDRVCKERFKKLLSFEMYRVFSEKKKIRNLITWNHLFQFLFFLFFLSFFLKPYPFRFDQDDFFSSLFERWECTCVRQMFFLNILSSLLGYLAWRLTLPLDLITSPQTFYSQSALKSLPSLKPLPLREKYLLDSEHVLTMWWLPFYSIPFAISICRLANKEDGEPHS